MHACKCEAMLGAWCRAVEESELVDESIKDGESGGSSRDIDSTMMDDAGANAENIKYNHALAPRASRSSMVDGWCTVGTSVEPLYLMANLT